MTIMGVVVVVLIIAWFIFLGYVEHRKPAAEPFAVTAASPEAIPYQGPILAASAETGVPAWLLVNLLLSESGLDPTATGGPNGDGSIDHGIAQLNGRYLTYFAGKYAAGKLDPYDPLQAIPVAARYMADLLKATKCEACAVAAYKAGLHRVLDWRAEGYILGIGEQKIAGEHTCGGKE